MITSIKRLSRLLVLLLPLAPFAYAASSVDLSVTGLITPSACTPSLSQNGQVDYGKIPARELHADAYTPLPKSTLQLGVSCEGSTAFALRLTDNRADSSSGTPLAFGLGLINGNERLGMFHIVLSSPVADDAAVTSLQSMDEGQVWHPVDDTVALPPLRLAAFGDASSGGWAPLPVKQLRVAMNISTFIAPAQGLTLDHEVPLDGSATVDLIYL